MEFSVWLCELGLLCVLMWPPGLLEALSHGNNTLQGQLSVICVKIYICMEVQSCGTDLKWGSPCGRQRWSGVFSTANRAVLTLHPSGILNRSITILNLGKFVSLWEKRDNVPFWTHSWSLCRTWSLSYLNGWISERHICGYTGFKHFKP